MFSPQRLADPLTLPSPGAAFCAAARRVVGGALFSLGAVRLELGAGWSFSGRAALSLEVRVDDGVRFNISGFADLVDGGKDDTWRVWGFTSAAAMAVSMLLDDIDGDDDDDDDPDELVAALTGLDASHQEAIAVALGRWCGTRSATCSEGEAVNPTLDALFRHVELLKGLGDPLAAHDAQALAVLHAALVAL